MIDFKVYPYYEITEEDEEVAIHPRFSKLITSLLTAVENGEGMLDKEATSHDDLFDSFRMSLRFWR
jgi:hypothetical protein